jgi:hypothetical protein
VRRFGHHHHVRAEIFGGALVDARHALLQPWVHGRGDQIMDLARTNL